MARLTLIDHLTKPNLYPVGIISETKRVTSISTHISLERPEGLFSSPISSRTLAQLIVSRSARLGSTSCFFFSFKDEKDYSIAVSLINDVDLVRVADKSMAEQPADIKHNATHAEKSFTATGDKLAYHWPVFHKLAETGYGSIIRASIAPYQRCSSSCSFCSTANRNVNDTVPLEDAKRFVDALFFEQAEFNKTTFPGYNESYKQITGDDIRLKSLILTGGGQPNLWPFFEDFVKYVHSLGIELGLITNGFPKTISDDVYSCFSWIRISITPSEASPHYINGLFEDQFLPSCFETYDFLQKTTIGLSYVMGPWTRKEDIYRLHRYVEGKDFHYCRLLTDCNLPRDMQIQEHDRLRHIINEIEDNSAAKGQKTRLFHQFKYHASNDEVKDTFANGQCLLQSYGVFWDSTGHSQGKQSYCYPCDSVTVLASNDTGVVLDSARKFQPSIYGTVKWSDVSSLFTKPLRRYFDPREACGGCLFFRNNQEVSRLLGSTFPLEIEPTQQRTVHVNFP